MLIELQKRLGWVFLGNGARKLNRVIKYIGQPHMR